MLQFDYGGRGDPRTSHEFSPANWGIFRPISRPAHGHFPRRAPMNAQLQTYPASEFNLLINGRLVPGAATFDVINPATEDLLAVCPRADLNQLNQPVAAAKAAFPP